jgi:hypothetical protein
LLHDRPVTEPPHTHSSAGSTPARPVGPLTNRGQRLARIEQLVELQSLVVSRGQLRTSGWSGHHIQHEVDVGRWQAPAPGVVVLHTGELTEEQALWLGVLHAGDGAVLSHLTAARRAGLRWTGVERIDVMTPRGEAVTPLEGYFFHQTRRPYARWLKPVSGPPRLPIEYAALLAAERDGNIRRALGLIVACVQQQLTTAERFGRTIPLIRKLRNGKTFALVLDDVAGGAQSFAEMDVGRLCREYGLAQPQRQVVRFDKQGRRRYLDCVWMLSDGRVVVLEVDGSFHAEVVAWWSDMKRERAVVIQGDTVLRCSSLELRLEPEDVMADLRRIGVPGVTRQSQAS